MVTWLTVSSEEKRSEKSCLKWVIAAMTSAMTAAGLASSAVISSFHSRRPLVSVSGKLPRFRYCSKGELSGIGLSGHGRRRAAGTPAHENGA